MQIPWETIIPMVIQAISDCINNGDDEQEIRRRVRNPGGFARLRVSRKVRRELNMTRQQWRNEGDEIMASVWAEAQRATDADLDELIAEAKED